MLWKLFTLLLAFLCTTHISATSVKFTCPPSCDCSIALTVQKDLYDIKCSSLEPLTKQLQYHSKQGAFIRKLDLSNTHIKKLNVDTVNQLKNLEVLDVSNNQLTDLPTSLTLKQLTDIIMHHNQISTISYWFFPKSVRYIDLAYNAITEIPETILDVAKLEEVRIVGNALRCTCYNRNVYNELLKRSVIFDRDVCQYGTGEMSTWKQVHTTCVDADVQNDQADQFAGDIGSGDGEVVDLNEDTKFINDLDEFITVKNDDISTTTTTTTTAQLSYSINTTTGIDNAISNDFYFETHNRTTSDPLTVEEGSGDEPGSGIDYSDLSLDVSLENDTFSENSSSVSLPSSGEDYENEGSGSGDVLLTDEESESNETENTTVPLLLSPVNPDTFAPTTSTESTTTSTTTEKDTTPPVLPVTSQTESVDETTLYQQVPITEHIHPKYIGSVDAEIITHSTPDTHINEEVGQVIEEGPKKQAFGTYIFLAILLAVLICLIGYTVLKRRINRNNTPSNNRRQTADDLTNATEMKDIDKTVALLKEENEKKTSNGRINESTPMITTPPENNGVPKKSTDNVQQPPAENQRPSANTPEPTTPAPVPAPRTYPTDSNTINGSQPPAAERVKITMTELTDSIPKTPVLVTRTKSTAGDQIIVTPNLNQRPHLRNP